MKRFTRILGGLALAAVALRGGGTAHAAGKVAKLDAPALAQVIDQNIQAKLAAEKVTATAKARNGFIG